MIISFRLTMMNVKVGIGIMALMVDVVFRSTIWNVNYVMINKTALGDCGLD